MRKEELIRLYPWTNHPRILSYAEQFTPSEWQDMHNAGVPAFLTSGILDPLFIDSLFVSIHGIARHKDVISMLADGSGSFKGIVEQQIKLITQNELQQPTVRVTEMFEWLGPELIKRVEQEVSSYDMLDNLTQALSSQRVRDILEGKASEGQDTRKMLLQRKITFKAFFDMAMRLHSPSVKRHFPDWIEDSLELRSLANEFTDAQLSELGNVLERSILRDRELKCSFFRSVLLVSEIKGRQRIAECSDLFTFRELIQTLQRTFLHVTQTAAPAVKAFSDACTNGEFPILTSINSDNLPIHLIRKYNADYKSPHVLIPTDAKQRQALLECALRNAANAGTFWDLMVLTHEVSNLNAVGLKTGRTALHWAALYASKTGDRLCFDVLAKQPRIQLHIKDLEHKTPLDLWDFDKCPDDELMLEWVSHGTAALSPGFR